MRILAVMYSLMALLPLAIQAKGDVQSCPVVKIEAERLADLNVPRGGHTVLLLNGEPTVIGGHTTNFVPTPTLEYYKDGKWHLVKTAFSHDDGFAVQLSSGKVLIGGGHERNLGIGQSYEAELYDPLSHTCEGFGSLDTKRALASALALDNGRAVIAGNWYHDDAIEMFDGKNGFSTAKGVSLGRATPFILRTAKDDAIIFGGQDSIGRHITSDVVDRLRGESYHEPLLQEWHVPGIYIHNSADDSFIGDESSSEYTYLLALENAQGQIAIARVSNGEFSLLPTDVPVPMACEWGGIDYSHMVFVDRHAGMAYMVGCDAEANNKKTASRAYVLKIDYTITPARLTLCYTDVLTPFNPNFFVATADGNLMMVCGNMIENNFKPSGATWLLHVSSRAQAAGMGFPWWGWALIVLAIAALATGLVWLLRCRKSIPVIETETPTEEPCEEVQEAPVAGIDYTDLMQRLGHLMEEQRLFLTPDLKATDIASTLGTSQGVLSNAIKTHHNCTFPQFVNNYRIAYAQELMRNQPNLKMTEVYMASGFSSEASFYRIFKTITGFTPNEWKSNTDLAN
jgi:AraC-like DNA-binding protein